MDYLVTEAVVVKAMKEREEMQKKQKREEWKRNTGSLDQYR